MYLLLICFILSATPAWAVYDDVTVDQVEPVDSRGTVSITARFTGPSETPVRDSTLLPWNFLPDQLAEWSAGVIERLNGVKDIPTRVKSGDKLAITRPVRPVIEEPVRP